MNRRIRYWLWKWFGIMRTNERPAFEHYLNNGRWPWECDMCKAENGWCAPATGGAR